MKGFILSLSWTAQLTKIYSTCIFDSITNQINNANSKVNIDNSNSNLEN